MLFITGVHLRKIGRLMRGDDILSDNTLVCFKSTVHSSRGTDDLDLLRELTALHESCTEHLEFRSQAYMLRYIKKDMLRLRNEYYRLKRSTEGSLMVNEGGGGCWYSARVCGWQIQITCSRSTLMPFIPVTRDRSH